MQNTFTDRSVTLTALSRPAAGQPGGLRAAARCPRPWRSARSTPARRRARRSSGTAPTDVSQRRDRDGRRRRQHGHRHRHLGGPGDRDRAGLPAARRGRSGRRGLPRRDRALRPHGDEPRPGALRPRSPASPARPSATCPASAGCPRCWRRTGSSTATWTGSSRGRSGRGRRTRFTASGTYNTGTLTSTSSQTVTINPPIGGTKVLAVVATPGALTTTDSQISDRVEDNYSITYADDNTVQAGRRARRTTRSVLIYPSVRRGPARHPAARPGPPGAGAAQPDARRDGHDGGRRQRHRQRARSCTIPKAMHPLSTTLSGTRDRQEAGDRHRLRAPRRPAATVVANVPGGDAAEFAYDEGDR